MSENEESSNFEEMLKAVLGEVAANEIMRSLSDSGIDMESQFAGMFNPANFAQISQQLQFMLGSTGEGAVNWKVGEQVARETVASSAPDSLSAATAERARGALSAASLWLDPVTAIDPCSGPNQAWSRLDFVAHCLPTFRRLTEPVGENVARAFTSALRDQLEAMPEDMFAGFGMDPTQMMDGMISSLLGMQYGAGLAELAEVCFGTSDSGLPLVEGHTAALVPANVADFQDGIEEGADEVEAFVAVREQAAARLYSRVAWLRPQVLDAVAAYAAQIRIDMDAIEEQVREATFDMSSIHELDLTEVFDVEPTPTQVAMLAKLEHTLSLVEGWVSVVSLDAVVSQLPHAMALSELFGRRSAVQSPTNRVFGPLVGLEIAPRRVREAAAFWRMATHRLGIEGRDALWNHPDLLPSPEHLTDPASFFEPSEGDAVAEELEAFLAQVLDDADHANPEGMARPEGTQGASEPEGTEGDARGEGTSPA